MANCNNSMMVQNKNNKQWIHCQFNSEKIRYSERYRRPIKNRTSICSFTASTQQRHRLTKDQSLGSNSSSGKHHTVVFLPDGKFLRKYLTVLEEIVNQHTSFARLTDIKLILLESAAECMDYRNASFCNILHHHHDINTNYDSKLEEETKKNDNSTRDFTSHIARETPARNERNRIVKLCMEHKRELAYAGVEVIPFPDLTIKDDGDEDGTSTAQFENDDFDLFHFMDMCIEDRSKCALVRAAKFFYQTAQLEMKSSSPPSTNEIQPKHGNSCKNGDKDQIEIILLTDEDVSFDDYEGAVFDNKLCSLSMKAMNCDALISFVTSSFDIGGGDCDQDDEIQIQMIEDHWSKLKQSDEKEYETRNQQQLNKSSSSNGDSLHKKDRYGHFEYLHLDELQRGLQKKQLFKGKLSVTGENCREAYCTVTVQDGTKMTFFLNENNGHFNRAIHDDIVVIEPLPKAQWEQPVGRKWLTHVGNDQDDRSNKLLIERGKDVQGKGSPNNGIMPTAQVVGLCNVGNGDRRQFIATLVPKSTVFQNDDNAIVVVPMDSKIPRIRIKTRIDHERIVNKRLLVEIDSWNLNSLYPSGHYVKSIGDVGDLDTEINCLLIEHKIDLSPFSANALACLPQIRNGEHWKISGEDIKQRRDLRTSCRIFSVDPQGCQDIDDTMHARVLETGDIEVGVHIADVTHFVKLHSALDREAAARGTTFYLVDRRFDMLPSLLSSDLCSLHGGVDRFAVSVIWTLSPDLEEVKSTWYGRTVIHNIQAMTYEQAHNILHDEEPDDPTVVPPPLTAGAPVDRSLVADLKKDLKILTRLARKQRGRRETIGGAVDLSSGDRGSELKFVLDKDGRPIKVAPKKELEIHHTIAELMIMSNGFVAETIYKRFPDSSILRIHRKADVDSFEELEKLIVASGVKFDGSSNKSLAHTLKEAKLNQSSVQDSLFQSLATRAMSEAQYVCTGSLEEGVGLSHYGLGIGMYCHFTSPIRRYADIAVHHLLLASLSQKELHLTYSNKLEKVYQIPESNAISILSGDGLKNQNKDTHDLSDDLNEDFLDSLIEGSNELMLNEQEEKQNVDNQSIDTSTNLYKTTEMTRICENLNSQNRAAKNSSMKCQRLFLSLYFKNNTEVTQAVVIDLRQNGLIVYVPKFDMKGPLYLADRNNCVHINPKLMGLPASSGLPPLSGFSSVEGCRMFAEGRCTISNSHDSSKARVEVSLPGSTNQLIFKRLDVITVQVSCDLSNTIARIPPPRLHLVSLKSIPKAKQNLKHSSTNPRDVLEVVNNSNRAKNQSLEDHKKTPESIYKILSSIQIKPIIDIPMRFESTKKNIHVEGRVQTLKGRMHFGGFKENVSHSVETLSQETKKLSIEDQAKLGNYDASRRIERDATSRIQRKAAEKRNARRGKRK